MLATRPATPHIHPLHALLLGFPVALFTTALVTDIAYLDTAEMQWSNFAAWAITGALVMGAPVVAWSLLGAVRRRGTGGGVILYPLLIGGAWLLGLLNAFHHSGDAWASVGATGLILSLLCAGLAIAAAWLAFAPAYKGAAR